MYRLYRVNSQKDLDKLDKSKIVLIFIIFKKLILKTYTTHVLNDITYTDKLKFNNDDESVQFIHNYILIQTSQKPVDYQPTYLVNLVDNVVPTRLGLNKIIYCKDDSINKPFLTTNDIDNKLYELNVSQLLKNYKSKKHITTKVKSLYIECQCGYDYDTKLFNSDEQFCPACGSKFKINVEVIDERK